MTVDAKLSNTGHSDQKIRFTNFLQILAVAVIASVFLEMFHPVKGIDYIFASIIGRSVEIYLISGILPVVVWIIQSKIFHRKASRGIFLLWIFLICVLAYLTYLGAKNEQIKNNNEYQNIESK